MAALVLLSLSTSFPAVAEELVLPEISVTARGYEAETLATPQSIEILEPAERSAAAAPAGSLFRGEPGLAVQSDGAWGQNPVLRGLKKESIVVLVDGVRVNSAQPQGAIASFLDLGLMDRVEVVKGPTSVLYGSGAMGGAVNLITPEPGFSDRPAHSTRLSLGGSSVDEALSGAVLYDYAAPRHGLVLGAAARDADDYRSPDGRVPRTGYSSDSLLARYAFAWSPETTLKVNLQRHEDRDVWYPGSARTGGQPGGAGIPPPLGTVTIRSPRQSRELAELGFERALMGGELSGDVYRQEVYREIRAWSDTLNRDYVRNEVTFATDGARMGYLRPLGDTHVLNVGVEVWQMKADPERYIGMPPDFDPDGTVRRSPFRHGEITTTGLFVQDEILLDATTLTAGLRFDRTHGTAEQKGFGPAAQTTGLDKTDNTLSWSLGAIHSLSDTLNPYVNLGSAYRAADMRERFEDSARGDGFFHVGNPQLDPERATSLEVGLKGRSGRFDYRLAAFYTRIDDYIAGRVTGETHPGSGLPIKRTENLDRVVIRGLEGSLTLPVGAFVADAAFTWLRGDNRQDDEPLAETPPPELRIGLGQPAERGLYWRAQTRAVARQDRVATQFTNGGEDETPGFVTADLNLGWHFGGAGALEQASLDLHFTNLFDRRYHEHLTQGISGQEIKAPGRGVAARFTGRF
ncbi:TonB-dependent receptor [Thioalkalivibrio sulfidiphilus]|uniref:TonB-dependent receptor n=1 Tax=Thioalkalivibrio sulfidiphilus TaxID=1033854 RepID=UPI003B395545